MTGLLSVLVFQAIGKYIHPTRYRQIIEMESVNKLDLQEQRFVSEDQKHSSNVARVHYQKLRSRDVALKGRSCMEKLRGDGGKVMDRCVQELREPDLNVIDMQDAQIATTNEIASHISEDTKSATGNHESASKIHARGRHLFERRHRKVWISLVKNFEMPALSI